MMKLRTISRVLVIAGFVLLLVGAVFLKGTAYPRIGQIILATAFLFYLIGRLINLGLFLKQRKEKI